jgi:YHS domain-containing protein
MSWHEKDCPVCEEPVYTTTHGTTVCGNCGMAIVKKGIAHSLWANGMKRYFCKEKCLAEFERENQEVISQW